MGVKRYTGRVGLGLTASADLEPGSMPASAQLAWVSMISITSVSSIRFRLMAMVMITVMVMVMVMVMIMVMVIVRVMVIVGIRWM